MDRIFLKMLRKFSADRTYHRLQVYSHAYMALTGAALYYSDIAVIRLQQ